MAIRSAAAHDRAPLADILMSTTPRPPRWDAGDLRHDGIIYFVAMMAGRSATGPTARLEARG